MERLTQTSDKGGVAFTFDLDIACKASEAHKILRLAEKLKEYEDAEEQGLFVKGDDIRKMAVCERRKAINDFVTEAMKKFTEFDLQHGYPTVADCKTILRDLAEQKLAEMKGE